jgi:hypothetical protein
MISLRNRRIIILCCTSLLILLMIAGFVSVISHSSLRDGPKDFLSATATPGLVIYGNVRKINGEGVENVNIYRGYAGYPGVVIATTDANGDYESDFGYIPGDEMVTVRADGLGFTYEPENYIWRHYYGYERERCDFVAHFPTEIFLPIQNK